MVEADRKRIESNVTVGLLLDDGKIRIYNIFFIILYRQILKC